MIIITIDDDREKVRAFDCATAICASDFADAGPWGANCFGLILGEEMRIVLLSALALLVPAVAYADGEAAMPEGWFGGVQAGWTQMDMPAHPNGGITLDQGGGFRPLALQTDVEGNSFRVGIVKDTASGWRFGVFGKFFDGNGRASESFPVSAGTPVRLGSIDGISAAQGALASRLLFDQTLSVDVNSHTIAGSVGRPFAEMLRADLAVSYDTTDTDDHNRLLIPGTDFRTNTSFSARTVEFSARLSAMLPLSDAFSFNIAGAAGYGLRQIDMKARQMRVDTGTSVVTNDQSISRKSDVNGFLGHLDAALDYAASRSITIGLTANYDYDSMVPAYVAPVYPAPVAVGSPATFTTEGESTMTYGVRVIGHF